MNAPINDGGPAFPVADFDIQTFRPQNVDDMRRLLSGMSLRDYFAAKALTGGLAGNWRDNDYKPASGLTSIENTARAAYQFADAMLKARTA